MAYTEEWYNIRDSRTVAPMSCLEQEIRERLSRPARPWVFVACSPNVIGVCHSKERWISQRLASWQNATEVGGNDPTSSGVEAQRKPCLRHDCEMQSVSEHWKTLWPIPIKVGMVLWNAGQGKCQRWSHHRHQLMRRVVSYFGLSSHHSWVTV